MIFRRTSVEFRSIGGLWAESKKIYMQLQGAPVEGRLEWVFPTGLKIKFAHLEHEDTVYGYQGSQIPFIGFDELTHFTESQFIYLLSRNRSDSGVPGYIRATCNPDATSWVRKWVDWYIDQDGYAIPERSGVIRWFARNGDALIWGDNPEQIKKDYGSHLLPKSFTFISSKLEDNQILMKKDPAYLANLQALPRVERMRLLGGNWNVRGSAGNYFQRSWFEIIDQVPEGWTSMIRYWDLAATLPYEGNQDPDWTRGLKMYKYPDGTYVVVDLKSMRDRPSKVEMLVKNTASQDTQMCTIGLEQDPGSAGVSNIENYIKLLAGYMVDISKPSNAKAVRAKAVSAQSEFGKIKILRAPWNDEFFSELENFSDDDTGEGHDDIVDVFSGAFNVLMRATSWAQAII